MNRQYEAILIPGGGLTDQGDLPAWTKARLDLALEHDQGDPFFITLSAGTTHKAPPLNQEGFPIYESQAAAAYLASLGINLDRILTEISSYDTIGNAYFARVIHTDLRNLRDLLIITSQFHMPRTQAAFEWVFGLTPDNGYTLDFLASENVGLSQEVLAERNQREAESVKKLAENASRISTLADFHTWLFLEHAAYATGKKREIVSGKILSSY